MRGRTSIFAALAATVAALALALVFGGGTDSKHAQATRQQRCPASRASTIVSRATAPGRPAAPSSSRWRSTTSVSPRAISAASPQLGEGHLRFSLNRVPDCVDPVKLLRAINSPIGNGRLVGASFDYPQYSGPNGVLAERIGTAGSYSPGTRPEIFYHDLPPGFYRLVVNLAQNNGATMTPFHAVTNFQILPRPGHGPKPCAKGKVPSAKAAARRRSTLGRQVRLRTCEADGLP